MIMKPLKDMMQHRLNNDLFNDMKSYLEHDPKLVFYLNEPNFELVDFDRVETTGTVFPVMKGYKMHDGVEIVVYNNRSFDRRKGFCVEFPNGNHAEINFFKTMSSRYALEEAACKHLIGAELNEGTKMEVHVYLEKEHIEPLVIYVEDGQDFQQSFEFFNIDRTCSIYITREGKEYIAYVPEDITKIKRDADGDYLITTVDISVK